MVSQSPLVSIHLVNYNCGPYLKEAVDSALQQTIADFEFIIADDGSKDESLAYFLTLDDPRIRLFLNEHQGLEKTRQEVLKQSRGKWTAIFDADDISKKDRLEILLNLAETTQGVIVGGQIEEIDEKGEFLSRPNLYSTDEKTIRKRLGKKYSICHGASIFLTDLAREVGGYLVQLQGWGEDEDLFLRMAQRGRIVNSDRVVLERRIRRDSVCNQFQSRVLSRIPPGKKAALDSIYCARLGKSYLRGENYLLAQKAFYQSLRLHWLCPSAGWGIIQTWFKKNLKRSDKAS